MPRRALLPWRRLVLQTGALAGIALAFAGGEASLDAAPPPGCKNEDACSFAKPLLLFALEYGAAMNLAFEGEDISRWTAAVTATNALLAANNGFLTSNFVVGLLRFGHDPDPRAPGTTIAGDTSGLVDGLALDVPLADEAQPNAPLFECTANDAVAAALAAIPPPPAGVGAWTRGALLFAQTYLDEVRAAHPPKSGVRLASIVALTQGVWTDATGQTKAGPPADDPVPVAAELFEDHGIPTYVIAFGDAEGDALADALAAAAGTGAAFAATDPQTLIDAFQAVIQDLIAQQVAPNCTPGRPRVMFLLDASSRMLNLAGARAPMGQGGWEQARVVLGGLDDGLLSAPVSAGKLEEFVHTGLAVYGSATPAEEALLVQYGACRHHNFEWALDPASSCVAPGCTDPYAGPPIAWTFQDGALIDPPNFGDTTLSRVPRCDLDPQAPDACAGSASHVHRGLELVQANLAAYKAACAEPNSGFACDDATIFRNVLITDGLHDSTDTQAQAPLVAMHAAGVTTYVLGLGELAGTPEAQAKLAALAGWGSGGTLPAFTLETQGDLEAQLVAIVESIPVDPCCKYSDCTAFPGDVIEPDPIPGPTFSSSTGADASTGTTDTSTTGGPDETTSTTTTPVDPTTSGETTTPPTTASPDTTATSAPTPTSSPDWPPPDWPPFDPDFSTGSSGDTTGQDTVDDGCGCATTPRTPWLAAMLLLALRRRRTR